MSKIPDIPSATETEAGMHFEERSAWLASAVSVVAFAVYLVVLLRRADGLPLVEVPYVGPMLWTIGGAIAATIVLHILVGIFSGGEVGQRDVRDRQIERFAEHVGRSMLVVGGLAALILAMLELRHFWIANAIYLSFLLSSLLEGAAKILAYRRGFQDA